VIRSKIVILYLLKYKRMTIKSMRIRDNWKGVG